MLYVVIAGIFILGYMAIAFEHNIHVNKAASALLTAIALWVLPVSYTHLTLPTICSV